MKTRVISRSDWNKTTYIVQTQCLDIHTEELDWQDQKEFSYSCDAFDYAFELSAPTKVEEQVLHIFDNGVEL